MSALAALMAKLGFMVSGCDNAVPDKRVTQILSDAGVSFLPGHSPQHVSEIDCLVYTSAVSKKHPEIITAQNRGIKILHRSEMLAELMQQYKSAITVAGAHGKTSTSALIAWILHSAGLEPTVVIGGVASNFVSNMCNGDNNLFVAEADESDRSFLRYKPSIAVITNIDTDHLDTYKDLDDVEQTFLSFLGKVKVGGLAIVCSDNESVRKVLPDVKARVITYGVEEKFRPTFLARNIVEKRRGSEFDFVERDKIFKKLYLPIPGQYSVLNALAAIAAAREYGVNFEAIAEALKTFCGVERRFEFKGNFNGAMIFDDYAHHPAEMIKAVEVARRLAKGKLYIAFQPHRFTRTQRLWHEFVGFFTKVAVNKFFVFNVYPASEKSIKDICSIRLVKEISALRGDGVVEYYSNFADATKFFAKTLQEGDVLLTLGAGDAYKIGDELIRLV